MQTRSSDTGISIALSEDNTCGIHSTLQSLLGYKIYIFKKVKYTDAISITLYLWSMHSNPYKN